MKLNNQQKTVMLVAWAAAVLGMLLSLVGSGCAPRQRADERYWKKMALKLADVHYENKLNDVDGKRR
jgi:hypothetical protein